ncbi:hypothetical protein FCH28_05205 [Streptomyces piniterrae]|uniref:Uncharacterized protein n=1 Tax=Streptomyces piniterrae TaxID=2571125 RepID=A0A4U0NR02_9ACTN|nr:DUF6114 domain-containing protein [Streptomyces piniterrae]TJZ56903.1 hypothetical protein FCH28_05205 [Streptomyces piniterrae]
MITFVLGFLAELAKETGSWLDRLLPAARLRRSLRHWRRRRPFWAGLWTAAGGVELIVLPLAPLPLMLKVGIGAMSAIGVGLVLIAGGLFFLFAPAQRMFISVVTAIASLVSLATTNLGGFGIGCGLGLFGSSMAFGWLPHEQGDEGGDGLEEDATDAGERDEGAGGWGGGAGERDGGAGAGAWGARAGDAGTLETERAGAGPGTAVIALTLPLALAAALVVAAPAPTAAAAPPGVTAGGATARPGDPRDTPAEVALPCLTGVDTGGADNPAPTGPPPSGQDRPTPPTKTAKPGTVGDPDDLTALKPPLVIGDQPGPGRAGYPISPYHPTVRATRLTATDAIIHGATYLPTVGGGRMKVLWVHAARIVADDYHLEVKGPDGTTHRLDVQLDIRNVDVYATYLKGSVEIPWLKVNTPQICVGADVIPANLPLAVQLPELTMEPVTASQVLVDAADVHYTVLRNSH